MTGYAAHKNLNQQLILSQSKDIDPARAHLVPRQTLCGKSLGSLGQYSQDWNDADTGEVSSAPTLPPLLTPNPDSPISLGQKMFAAKAAILDVDRAVEVTFLFLYS